jgi:hypothetical protein
LAHRQYLRHFLRHLSCRCMQIWWPEIELESI